MNGPPPHFWEKYDIVHIRFFTSKEHGTKPAGVLRNCLKLLSKRLHLESRICLTCALPQNQEDTCNGMNSMPKEAKSWSQKMLFIRVMSARWPNKSATTVNIRKLTYFLFKQAACSSSVVNAMTDDGDYLRWVEGLGQTFKDCGLEQVNIDVRQEPYQITKMSSEMLCMDCEDCSWATDDLRHGDRLREISQNAHLEMRQGVTISKTLQVVVGRKPQRQQGLSAGKRLVPPPIHPNGLPPSTQPQWSEEQYRPARTH